MRQTSRMARVTKMASVRRERVGRMVVGGFIVGVMMGLALLILTPFFAAGGDTPSHLVAQGSGAASDIAGAELGNRCAAVAVHDGDSFRCDGMKIRLVAARGPVDAPDYTDNPRCAPERDGWCDQQLAERARDRLTELLGRDRVTVACDGHDRYGRALCRAAVDGRDVGDMLVDEGLAKIMPGWR